MPLNSNALTSLPFGRHVESVRTDLKRRCTTLCEALEGLPEGCTFRRPQGGYFVWIKLPRALPDNVNEILETHRVQVSFVLDCASGSPSHFDLLAGFGRGNL